MAKLTLAQWTALRDAAYAALFALTQKGAASYTVDGNTYTRQDLDKLRTLIRECENIIASRSVRKTKLVSFEDVL